MSLEFVLMDYKMNIFKLEHMISRNFILATSHEFLLIYFLNQNNYSISVFGNYEFFIIEFLLTCIFTYMYHFKIKTNIVMVFVFIFIVSYIRKIETNIIIRHIISQSINYLYFSDTLINTKQFFEHSFGRNLLILLFYHGLLTKIPIKFT